MKTMSARKFLIIFGSIFLIVGLVLVALSFFLRSKQIPKENRVYTEATITNIETYRDGSDDLQHRVTVSYSAEGQEFETVLGYYRSGFREGKQITIYYEKGMPTHIGSDGGDAVTTIILLAIGIPFAAAGGFIVYKGAIGKKLLSRLMESGTRISAVYAGTECLTKVSINGRHPYVIHARAYDPETMQERLFDSDWFMRDPAPFVERANIEYFSVYLDPGHPKRYYLDDSAVKSLMEG